MVASNVASEQWQKRKRLKLKMRAAAVHFVVSLEDEMIAEGMLRPDERACMTREQRRQVLHVDNTP
jgi:hypothetical protein